MLCACTMVHVRICTYITIYADVYVWCIYIKYNVCNYHNYIIHALCAYSIHTYFNIRHTVYIVSLHVSPVWVFPIRLQLHLTATGTVVICRHDTLQ